MSRRLLDTTVRVDHLRGDDVATTWLLGLDEVPLCSELSRTELLVGLRAGERRRAEVLFDGLEWVEVDEAIARRAGELGRRFRASHRLGAVDLVVAASVVERAAKLATSNPKPYPMFKGLARPY